MRGYISFLLVLASLAILIVLANSYLGSKTLNFSKAIALERMEQLSLDAKRSMLTAAKYGAIAGFSAYVEEVLGSEGALAFDPLEAKERVRQGVVSALALASMTDSDYEVSLWCGEIQDENELGALAESSLRNGKAEMCPSCKPLALCGDYIDMRIISDAKAGDFEFASLALGSRNLGESPKLFGATIYSKKFNISKASYIPTSEKIFEQQPYRFQAAGTGG